MLLQFSRHYNCQFRVLVTYLCTLRICARCNTAGNVHVHAFVLMNQEIKLQYINICDFFPFYLNGYVLIWRRYIDSFNLLYKYTAFLSHGNFG